MIVTMAITTVVEMIIMKVITGITTVTTAAATAGLNKTGATITTTETGAREVTANHQTQGVIKIMRTVVRAVMASLTKTMADTNGVRAIQLSQVKIMVVAVAGVETSTLHRTWAWHTEWAAINKHDLKINKIYRI